MVRKGLCKYYLTNGFEKLITPIVNKNIIILTICMKIKNHVPWSIVQLRIIEFFISTSCFTVKEKQ